MENIFLHLLNLSITANYIILAVMLLRFVLFKAPKWINCLLWSVVGLRLILPFSLESILSLVPSPEPIPNDIMLSPEPHINTGIYAVNSTLNPIISESFTPVPSQSANPLQIVFFVATVVWLVGLTAMLIWGSVSYLRLRKKVSPSLLVKDNIYFCDSIPSPFILGLFRPRICLPSSISETDMAQVIAHEHAHLKRKDHIWKPLGFVLLAVYWFDPLLWAAYILFCRDIEKACDEKVIRNMPLDERKEYSSSLLSFNSPKSAASACPLAFGEVGVRSRIKSILNYKKPAFRIIAVAAVLCIALAIGFLTYPPTEILGETDPNKLTNTQTLLMSRFPEYFGLDATNGLDVYVSQMAPNSYSFGLMEHSEKKYDPLDPYPMPLTMKGATTIEMRHILATYDISKEMVYIVPWQNPISSYIGPHFIGSSEEEIAKKQEEYKKMILDKLFNDQPLGSPVHDTAIFDMDGDGIDEHCALGYGMTSGLFTFTFSASEFGSEEIKYYNVFCSPWYKLSFKRCDDGIWRVQGITQDDPPEVHLFDISIVDGNINLTENGEPIGEIMQTYKMPVDN